MNREAVWFALRRVAVRLRRHFTTQNIEERSLPTMLRDQWLATERLGVSVRVVYVFPAFWMTTKLFSWQQLVFVSHPEWLWPVKWLGWFTGSSAAKVLLCTCIAASWLASACCAFRWARALALLALVEFLGLCFSGGKIHHLMHGWVLTLAVLVALPRGFDQPSAVSRGTRLQTLLVYGLAQALFALTYTLSGVGKVLGIAYQAWQGEETALHPRAFSRHVAARLLETGDASLLGDVAIEHGTWLWPFVIATIYLQLSALHFAARPRLHRVLAFGLIGFHMLSAATLFIDFTPAMALSGLLFAGSPTAPPSSWRAVVSDLPFVGRATRLLKCRRHQKPARVSSSSKKSSDPPTVRAWRTVQRRFRGKL